MMVQNFWDYFGKRKPYQIVELHMTRFGNCFIKKKKSCHIQWNFHGSNTDGSFTTAVSNSFLSPLEQIPQLQIWDN